MKKAIEIQETKEGFKYFRIYEVVCETEDGTISTYERYLNITEAIHKKDFLENNFYDKYKYVYVNREIVWIE